VLSFGYILGVVLLPKSFHLLKVTVLGDGCVPMAG
jgi:hypothetical protein